MTSITLFRLFSTQSIILILIYDFWFSEIFSTKFFEKFEFGFLSSSKGISGEMISLSGKEIIILFWCKTLFISDVLIWVISDFLLLVSFFSFLSFVLLSLCITPTFFECFYLLKITVRWSDFSFFISILFLTLVFSGFGFFTIIKFFSIFHYILFYNLNYN